MLKKALNIISKNGRVINYFIATAISAALSALLGTVTYNEMMAHLDIGRSFIVPMTLVFVIWSFVFQMIGAAVVFENSR